MLRSADAMVLCHAADAPMERLHAVRAELDEAGIDLPTIVAVTKTDDVAAEAVQRLVEAIQDVEVVAVSILDEASLDVFRDRVRRLTGLHRIYLTHRGEQSDAPIALPPPVTVIHVANAIHHELAARCRGARLWGPSAHFGGERVGREHPLVDGDCVEILS